MVFFCRSHGIPVLIYGVEMGMGIPLCFLEAIALFVYLILVLGLWATTL
jgi:hypothetical protein